MDVNVTTAELHGLLGNHEVSEYVWRREYQKLEARIAELEAQVSGLVIESQNGHRPMMPGKLPGGA